MNSRVMDDFSEPSSWLAVTSGDARLTVTSEEGRQGGRALRLDFDFMGGGGFVVIRKVFALRLPEAYGFTFTVRGEAPRNNLEFKLADTSGRNVWRWMEQGYEFCEEPRSLCIKSSQIEFAWGPAGGGILRKLGAVEFVISAGLGGKGTVWLEDFRFVNRTIRKTPLVTSSTSARGTDASHLLGSKAGVGWRSARGDASPWVRLDFHGQREYGGLIIDWAPSPATRSFTVSASQDGETWQRLHQSVDDQGSRSYLYLPGGESRHLLLAFDGPVAILHLEVKSFEFSRSVVDFFHAIATRSGRGRYPRWLLREQSYWTCAGSPEGRTCALINEDGLVEPDMGTFTLEPWIGVNDRVYSWADARRRVCQGEDGLAIPSAHWKLPGLTLETTVFGTGRDGDAVMFVRYRLRSTGKVPLKVHFYLAVRPFEVNPPWQSSQGDHGWVGLGGVSEIYEIAWKEGAAQINGDKWVVPLQKPRSFGTLAFQQGNITDFICADRLPTQTAVRDEFGFASAAMRFDLTLKPKMEHDLYVAVPFGFQRLLDAGQRQVIAAMDGAAQFEEAVQVMRRRTGTVKYSMPEGVAREAARTFRTAAGQILINRDGPALHPGPRRYTRSWVRDGVIMGAALMRIGDYEALPEFIRWYAPYQREDGFVPCCVDRTGPDWLVEHDSHGQLIYGVMESYRFTGDRGFLLEMWPFVLKAARFIEQLRSERLTPEYETPEKRARYGLLPESASHEGYLAHPVHAYWDDFWALRGLKDAAAMATELGHGEESRDFTALAYAFRDTLCDSINLVIADKGLHYVPGSVEWADFDPTATSNAVTLLQSMAHLPMKQLDEMFSLFVRDFRRKHGGEMEWNNYTAYEIRIVGALVHLGKRAEALELLEFFLTDRRPRHWNQWPEISWKDPRSPGHLGDVPHTWIAAEYMLVFAGLFAYEREADDALIIGAGVDDRWLAHRGGISVCGLPTWYGRLDLTLDRRPDGSLFLELGGALRLPRGGFVLRPPGGGAICNVKVNGRDHPEHDNREVVVRELPAQVVVSFVSPED